MELILIRHGETLWNQEGRIQGFCDIDLSDAGLRQARQLAWSLRTCLIHTIYSSPLIRARKTAEIINKYHSAPIHLDPGLREMDNGDFEGLFYQELMAREKDFIRHWLANPASVKMPHGESLLDVQIRAWKVIENALSQRGNCLVVSHNFTIASILCRIKNISLSEFRSVCVEPASKTIIRFRNGSPSIDRFNDRLYLQELPEAL